jgi:hypothetical protein
LEVLAANLKGKGRLEWIGNLLDSSTPAIWPTGL